MHKNMRYHFEVAQETVTKTADEVKAKYEKAKQTTLTHKELVDAMVEDYASLQLRVSKLLDEVRKSVNLLRQIALRDDPLSQIDYIDLMIQSEEQGHKPGYKERGWGGGAGWGGLGQSRNNNLWDLQESPCEGISACAHIQNECSGDLS